MTSRLQVAVRQWRELGLMPRNRHRDDGDNQDETQTTIPKENTRQKKKEKEDEYIIRMQQTTLTGANLDEKDTESFGDTMSTKENNNFRVVFQNIKQLPGGAMTARSRRVVDTIKSTEADVFTMAEISLFWPKVATENQWFERIIGKFRAHRSIFGCNSNEVKNTGLYQYGGVGLVSTDEGTNRARECGKDPKGLGRWVWMKFQGNNNHTTRVITLYRPCRTPNKERSV